MPTARRGAVTLKVKLTAAGKGAVRRAKRGTLIARIAVSGAGVMAAKAEKKVSFR